MIVMIVEVTVKAGMEGEFLELITRRRAAVRGG